MTFSIVRGHWRRTSPSVVNGAQTVASTHAPFPLPIAPEPARVPAASTRKPQVTITNTDIFDDFFGATRNWNRHHRGDGLHLSPGGGISGDIPPPPYADAELPTYSPEPNDEEPVTLAKYLFKFGFLFPPLWVLGAIIWMFPLDVPEDFEPFKSGAERVQLVRVIRHAEVRWAKCCAWALGALFVLVGVVTGIAFAVT